MPVTDISVLNKGWGICGFASALAALYEHGQIKPTVDKAAASGDLKFRLLAEIKSFLVTLQAEGKEDMLRNLETFTRSFGAPFDSFTVEGYISKINAVASTGASTKDSGFSMAMTPEAVVEYLKLIGGRAAARQAGTDKIINNTILGLGTNAGPYKGLRHWVYHKSAKEVYNYGEIQTLEQAKKKYQIVYQICF